MNEKLFRRYFFISLIMCAVIIFVFAILNAKFSTETESWLDGGAWASIIIGAISASSTVFLGLIAYWQNKKQREDNERAQRKIEQQAKAEKQDFERQRKLDVEIRHIDAYRNRLLAIEERRMVFNIVNEFYAVCREINSSREAELSSQELRDSVIFVDNKISSIILFLNHMQNTTLYNQYYIPAVEELVLKTVRVRKAIERFASKYVDDKFLNDKHMDKETTNGYKKDCADMIQNISYLDCLWLVYVQNIYDVLYIIEYNGDLTELNRILENNETKTKELREKVSKLGEET